MAGALGLYKYTSPDIINHKTHIYLGLLYFKLWGGGKCRNELIMGERARA